MSKIAVLSLIALTAACATLQTNTGSPQDPAGNLKGDASRGFVDVVHSKAVEANGEIVFEVCVAAPFPEAAAMAGGKRVDYIWLVNIDRDAQTGQPPFGNDYNIHLWLDETGWHPAFFKVSPVAEKDGVTIDLSKFHMKADGATASLSVPREYLPARAFDGRLRAMTDNAPGWTPKTQNPDTAVAHFG